MRVTIWWSLYIKPKKVNILSWYIDHTLIHIAQCGRLECWIFCVNNSEWQIWCLECRRLGMLNLFSSVWRKGGQHITLWSIFAPWQCFNHKYFWWLNQEPSKYISVPSNISDIFLASSLLPQVRSVAEQPSLGQVLLIAATQVCCCSCCFCFFCFFCCFSRFILTLMTYLHLVSSVQAPKPWYHTLFFLFFKVFNS